MISYMKDICNLTAWPMEYIYNSKQSTLKLVSSDRQPPSRPPLTPFLPGETNFYIIGNPRSKKKKKVYKKGSFLWHTLFFMKVYYIYYKVNITVYSGVYCSTRTYWVCTKTWECEICGCCHRWCFTLQLVSSVSQIWEIETHSQKFDTKNVQKQQKQ